MKKCNKCLDRWKPPKEKQKQEGQNIREDPVQIVQNYYYYQYNEKEKNEQKEEKTGLAKKILYAIGFIAGLKVVKKIF